MAAPTYNTVTITTNATLIAAANPERKGLLIANNGDDTVYIGFTSAVTTTTGFPLYASATLSNDNLLAAFRGNVYGIVASATQDVRYMEWDQ